MPCHIVSSSPVFTCTHRMAYIKCSQWRRRTGSAGQTIIVLCLFRFGTHVSGSDDGGGGDGGGIGFAADEVVVSRSDLKWQSRETRFRRTRQIRFAMMTRGHVMNLQLGLTASPG